MALMNISWKFEELILINNKAMSIRTCVCNAFLNMTSLMLIITFWGQQRCVNIFLPNVHAKNNNPRNLFEGIYFTFYWKQAVGVNNEHKISSCYFYSGAILCFSFIFILILEKLGSKHTCEPSRIIQEPPGNAAWLPHSREWDRTSRIWKYQKKKKNFFFFFF